VARRRSRILRPAPRSLIEDLFSTQPYSQRPSSKEVITNHTQSLALEARLETTGLRSTKGTRYGLIAGQSSAGIGVPRPVSLRRATQPLRARGGQKHSPPEHSTVSSGQPTLSLICCADGATSADHRSAWYRKVSCRPARSRVLSWLAERAGWSLRAFVARLGRAPLTRIGFSRFSPFGRLRRLKRLRVLPNQWLQIHHRHPVNEKGATRAPFSFTGGKASPVRRMLFGSSAQFRCYIGKSKGNSSAVARVRLHALAAFSMNLVTNLHCRAGRLAVARLRPW